MSIRSSATYRTSVTSGSARSHAPSSVAPGRDREAERRRIELAMDTAMAGAAATKTSDIMARFTPIILEQVEPSLLLVPPAKAVLKAFAEQRDIFNDELMRLFEQDSTYPLHVVAMVPTSSSTSSAQKNGKSVVHWCDKRSEELRACHDSPGAMLLHAAHYDAKTGYTRDVEFKYQLNGFLSPANTARFFTQSAQLLREHHPSTLLLDAIRKRMPKTIRWMEKILKYKEVTIYPEEAEAEELKKNKLFHKPKSSSSRRKKLGLDAISEAELQPISIRIPLDMKLMKKHYPGVAEMLSYVKYLKFRLTDPTEKKTAARIYYHHQTLEIHFLMGPEGYVWHTIDMEPVVIDEEIDYISTESSGCFHMLVDFKLRIVQYRLPLVRFKLDYDVDDYSNLWLQLRILELKSAALDGLAEIGGLPIRKIKALLEDTFKLNISIDRNVPSSDLASSLNRHPLSSQLSVSSFGAGGKSFRGRSDSQSSLGSKYSTWSASSSTKTGSRDGERDHDYWLLSVDIEFEFVSKVSGVAKAVGKNFIGKIINDSFVILYDWMDVLQMDLERCNAELVLMPAALWKAAESVKLTQQQSQPGPLTLKDKAWKAAEIAQRVVVHVAQNKPLRRKLLLIVTLFLIGVLIASIVTYSIMGLLFHFVFATSTFVILTKGQEQVENGSIDLDPVVGVVAQLLAYPITASDSEKAENEVEEDEEIESEDESDDDIEREPEAEPEDESERIQRRAREREELERYLKSSSFSLSSDSEQSLPLEHRQLLVKSVTLSAEVLADLELAGRGGNVGAGQRTSEKREAFAVRATVSADALNEAPMEKKMAAEMSLRQSSSKYLQWYFNEAKEDPLLRNRSALAGRASVKLPRDELWNTMSTREEL